LDLRPFVRLITGPDSESTPISSTSITVTVAFTSEAIPSTSVTVATATVTVASYFGLEQC
jgi:hypothetical protein